MPGKKRSKGTKDVFVAPITGRPAVQKYTKDEEWLPYKTKIIELLREDRSQAEISSILKSEYNFSITIEQLKTRLNIWGIRRNFTKAQKWFILNEIDKRGSKLLFRYEDQAKGSYINPDRINRVIAHRSREEEGTWLESSCTGNSVGLIACSPPLQENVADERITADRMLLDETMLDEMIVNETFVDETIVNFDSEYRTDIIYDNIEDMVVDQGTRAVGDDIDPPVDNPPSSCTVHVVKDGSCINDEHIQQEAIPIDVMESEQIHSTVSEDEPCDEDVESLPSKLLQKLRITSDYGTDADAMTLNECMSANGKAKVALTEQLGRRVRAAITRVLIKYFGIPISVMNNELRNDLTTLQEDDLVRLGEEIDSHLRLPNLLIVVAAQSKADNPRLKVTSLSELLNGYSFSKKAAWHFAEGEFNTSLDLCDKAYSAFYRNLGPYHLRTLESVYHQGKCLRSLYRLKKARRSFLHAATKLEVAHPQNLSFREKIYRAYVDCCYYSGQVWSAWIGIWKSLSGNISTNILRAKRYQGEILGRTEILRGVLDILSNLYNNTDSTLVLNLSEASWMLCRRRYGKSDPRTQGARLAFICSLLKTGHFKSFRKQLSLMKNSSSYYFNHDFVRLRSLRTMKVMWEGGTCRAVEMILLDLLGEIETPGRGRSFDAKFMFYQQIQFDILRILGNIMLTHGNDINKTIAYIERSISMAIGLFGTQHIDTIVATEKMVDALMKRGLVLYARPLQYYIIEKYERIYDKYHPMVSGRIGSLLEINKRCWEIEETLLSIHSNKKSYNKAVDGDPGKKI